jgi:hypothetical protein
MEEIRLQVARISADIVDKAVIYNEFILKNYIFVLFKFFWLALKAPSSNTLSTEDVGGRFTGVNAQDSNEFEISPATYYQQLEKLNKYLFQRPGSRAFSVPAYFPFFPHKVAFKPSPNKTSRDSNEATTNAIPKTPRHVNNQKYSRPFDFYFKNKRK